ncbi:acetyl-CoA carboxylase biotin carboxyl carrier protein subunit [Oceanobacillus damuensis]|uniref:acetyl-CoA carboxylase biotin carboxyl carrier protein subunit n=1 Tax=Oceanobacillus damuensis TaxID=937928 RepID=UPI000833731C|nr:acetyl-CoA carboxylase biotin carboxyl carrier protein subunit [Oceanobacillus damuensis]
MKIEVTSQMTGNVWKVVVAKGEQVEEDQEILILESMKMEIPVVSPDDGTIIELKVEEGDFVSEGDVIAILEED